jgi:homocysteine S-methyltransferase
MHDRLKEALAKRIVIFDGAMGTEIYRRNVFVNVSFDSLCLTAPEIVSAIHRAYREAGAEVLTTNSFGANANVLGKYGLESKVREINAAAVRLARECGGPEALVAGSVGPLGEVPYERGQDEEPRVAVVLDHARALAEAGADFLLMETLATEEDLRRALAAAGRLPGVPYAVSLSLDREGESGRGEPLARLLQAVSEAPRQPTAIGINCGEGPEASLNALEKLVGYTTLPIFVRPNAGTPRHMDGRTLYMASPEYLTTYALRYVALGARGVGGCCGTGPDHIRDLARSVRPVAASQAGGRVEPMLRAKAETPLKEPVPLAERSRFGAKLARGEWVTSVEIVPPRGYALDPILEKSAQCKAAGVDAINIPDGPRASSRLSPLITAHKIEEIVGIEAVLHICCRDRNIIGMQAELLGCAAVNVRNLLFITGDPPKLGDYPYASAVFDADSIGMVKIQARMNRGVDLGGKPFEPPTQAVIGVGADPNALDMARELRRTREKVEAGAEFIITQPVFDPAALLRFLDAIGDLGIPVIAGIWPLASYRNAEFMKNEVPGVTVPDAVLERMAKARTKEDQTREGIAIARESVAAVRSRIRGVQVSAPFGNVATALAVLA